MLGIVTGLAAEGRLARSLGRVCAGGGTAAGAEAAAERLVASGVRALLSFGLAGGLDPALRAGELLCPATVLHSAAPERQPWMAGSSPAMTGAHGERFEVFATDPVQRAQLGPGVDAPLLASERVISGAGYKAMLHQATGACAVDLESGAVARVAARHGLPFAVLRAVCDPAERTLTPAALAGLDPHGRIALPRVLAALLRQPGELPVLLALARDAAAARRALVRRVHEIGLRGGLVL